MILEVIPGRREERSVDQGISHATILHGYQDKITNFLWPALEEFEFEGTNLEQLLF